MEFLLLVAGAVLGLLLQVFFQDSLGSLAIRVFGPLSPATRSRELSGVWHAYYEVLKDGARPVAAGSPLQDDNIEQVRFSHVGRHFVGRNLKDSRQYFMRLRLEDACFLTGTWRDYSAGRYHFGGVQLWWHYNGKHLAGKFIGRDRNNDINYGIWVFARDKNELQGLVDDWRAKFEQVTEGKPGVGN